MKTAYFDCFAGASGDMVVAAMLDVGLDAEFLKAQLAMLGVKNLDIKSAVTRRAGLRALRFEVIVPEQNQHRNLKQIAEIINQSKISESAKKTAITIFNKLAQAEAAVHNNDINDIHFHEVGALDSIVDIVLLGFESRRRHSQVCPQSAAGACTCNCRTTERCSSCRRAGSGRAAYSHRSGNPDNYS